MVPPPPTAQVTPALFLSCATAAERLTVFVASTVAVDGLTVTLGLALVPVQLDIRKMATRERRAEETTFFKYTESSKHGSKYAHEAERPDEARGWRYRWSVSSGGSAPKRVRLSITDVCRGAKLLGLGETRQTLISLGLPVAIGCDG